MSQNAVNHISSLYYLLILWEITFFMIFHLKVFLFFLMAQALHRYSREPWLIAGILFFSILIKTPIHDVKLGI